MKSYRLGVLVGIVLVCVLGVVVFSVFGSAAGNACQGKSCEALPTKAQACYGPAAGKNPHCNPQPTATEVMKTEIPTSKPKPPTATPTATPATKLAEIPGTGACINGVCPPADCSLATIAAAQATMANIQSTLAPFYMNKP